MDTMSFVEIRQVTCNENFALLSDSFGSMRCHVKILVLVGSMENCHEMQVLFRFFISLLFHVHLVMTI